jgi:signal transduction histidine kinase
MEHSNKWNIIAEHQGDIRVESKPGEGATFIIELPLIKQL